MRIAYDLLVFYQVGLEYPAAQGGVDTQELNLLTALGSSSSPPRRQHRNRRLLTVVS